MGNRDKDLKDWLRQRDASSLEARVARLNFLREAYGSDTGRVFPGGTISHIAFEEARLAYLNGLFLSCVVNAQICLEGTLVGLLRMQGRNDVDNQTFAGLLQVARAEGYLTDQQYALFDRLRRTRNPYVHYRRFDASDSVVRRALTNNMDIDGVLRADATQTIEALLDYVSRVFGMGGI